MVGSPTWRKSMAFILGLSLCAALIFAAAADDTRAGSLVRRMRAGLAAIGGDADADGARRAVSISGKSARAYALEMEQLRRQPNLLLWAGLRVDPTEGDVVPEGVLPDLVAPRARVADALLGGPMEDLDYWICQFDGIDTPYSEFLAEIGAETVGFVPNSAYLVRATRKQFDEIQGHRDTRWIGRQLPVYKLDPGILEAIEIGDDTASLGLDSRGLLQAQISFYPGIDPMAYAPLLEALPGVEIGIIRRHDKESDQAIGGGFLVGIDPRDLKNAVIEIAGMRDVAALGLKPQYVTQNDQSVWQLQSGLQNPPNAGDTNYDVTAPLFARGITGRGMLGAIVDEGLENDLCQFRYQNTRQEACWPLSPSSSGTPPFFYREGGDIATEPFRTRARKVVAYYVQTNAAAYATDSQHGTTTSSCMLADNNAVLAARPLIRDLGEDQNVRPLDPGGDSNLGDWTIGQELRPELGPQVDDPLRDEFPGLNPFGTNIEHHQSRDGMAPGAQLVLSDIGDAAGNLVGTFTDLIILQTHNTGATVSNHSYGSPIACSDCYQLNGDAYDADGVMWRRRDMLVFSSAGNLGAAGAATIGGGIAHGKSVVVVGATERGNALSCNGVPCSPSTSFQGNDIADFSSKGPKSGGLIAPEICVPGIIISPTAGGIAVTPEDGTGSGDGGCGSTATNAEGGTSFASPTAAGLGLLIQQYFYDGFYPSGVKTPTDALRPTNALVRAVLVNSSRDLLGGRTDDTGLGQAHRPSFGQGWGEPRLDDTLYFQGDPVRVGGDPLYHTQRARFAVLTDTPNGADGVFPLSVEPGGKTRDEIVKLQQPTLSTGTVHEFVVNVVADDFNGDTVPDFDPANEFRITMAYSDSLGGTQSAPTVNDLDLEVIGPGPDGILQSATGINLLGDDVVYRTNPLSAAWSNGFSVASTARRIQRAGTPFDTTLPDKDSLNTIENVFIPSTEAFGGSYRIRVIGYSVPGGFLTNGRPNYILGDRPNVFDTNGDGTPDLDFEDAINSNDQGYALIVSGNFTSTQGLISLNQSAFGCSGEMLTVSLSDENGGAAPELPCTGQITAILTTTTGSPSFPADRELVRFTGTQPTYRSLNPVTGAEGFEVRLVNDPLDVVHGDGVIQIAHGETILARYTDSNPCGGEAFAQATVSCQPAIDDSGFLIEDGCDYTVTGDPNSGVTPDQFMDMGELNRYTVFFVNNGATDLHDPRVTLVPDPADPISRYVHVLNSPQQAGGLLPPGRRSNATFLVQLDQPGIPPRYQMDFIVEVTSPVDGLLFPDTFTQSQVLEADIEAHRYDTRDVNKELFGFNRFRRLKPGKEESVPPPNPPEDYVVNDAMWFDPDHPGAAGCDVPRHLWPARNQPPPGCPPLARTGNPLDPWDFDDSNEGFAEYAYDADQVVIGQVPHPFQFSWKNAPAGGGCGWEDQVHSEIATHGNPLPAGHPDLFTQPWGIWHTGAINLSTSGPFNGVLTDSQGAPYFEDPVLGNRNPQDHTILWDSRPPPDNGADNRAPGPWCSSYYENTGAGQYYRSMLVAPRLYRVHQSNADFKVEFDELRFFTRMDGHTIDARNWVAASWYVSNQPIDPASPGPPPTYSWGQFQYGVNIYTDKVRERWDVDDNDIVETIRTPNEDFPDLTYEDIFGPAASSWNISFGWTHAHFDGKRGRGQYGFGFDDVSFVWRETREVVDLSDCTLLPGLQPAIITFDSQRYNACDGTFAITLVDSTQALNVVAVAVKSSAENFEIALLTKNAVNGRFEGTMEFTTDPRNDAVGVLLVSAGVQDIGSGADTVTVEYDPDESAIGGPTNQADAEDLADWQDLDLNGLNDDTDGDGIPDAEDDLGRERRDQSVINCTSGRLFYIKHRLQQASGSPGDNDRFADHGERVIMALTLVSSIGSDLEDVDVRISTLDPICLINDTVHMDVLPGNSTRVETPMEFEFAVPASFRTTSLATPRTITFRIDVTGTNTANLNAFSTAGESFNTFLPLQAVLIADVDQVLTPIDYDDVRLPSRPPGPDRPLGTFFEAFEGAAAGAYGLDHPFIPSTEPGIQPGVLQDTTIDSRYGMAGNGGFCTECDFQTDCAIPANCDHQFALDMATGYPALVRATNGLDPGTYGAEWSLTQAPNGWAYRGVGAYKWGDPGSNATQADQHYTRGQYISLQLPPLRITSDPSVTPELSWWQIVDMWAPNFTSGLLTTIDGGVVEISASAVGSGDTGAGADRRNRSTWLNINPNTNQAPNTKFPLSSFRRMSPYSGVYDYETDVLNACRALFCKYKHPVYSTVGSLIALPTDEHASDNGTPGSWWEAKIDLSDYRGMEVVIQFSAECMQDLNIQPGSIGWLIDNVKVTGVSNRIGIRMQAQDLVADPCALVADFAATDPACFGQDVQFLDRHTGIGLFQVPGDPEPGEPWPIEYEWSIGSLNIARGLADDWISPQGGGVFGTYANPRVNLQAAAGISAPAAVPVTMRVYQNGSLVSTITRSIVYKDAPVPVITFSPVPALVGGTTRFQGSVAAFNPALDPIRTLVWEWDFGDGTPLVSSGPSVQHVFTSMDSDPVLPGNQPFTVTARAFDEDGCVGTDTESVAVVAAPVFNNPRMTFVEDCTGVPPTATDDGNADLNEYITVNLGFTNASTVTATGVIGYLSSPDTLVEITGAAARYPDVAGGAASALAQYTFIRRDGGLGASTCLVVPFQLTLLSNGGSVLQTLDFSYTMGIASEVNHAAPPSAPQVFCHLDLGNPTSGFTEFQITSPASGCLDGLEMRLTLTSTGRALIEALEVSIVTPDFVLARVLRPGYGPNTRGPFTLDFAFGSDASGVVPDTLGVVQDNSGPANTLEDSIEALLPSQLAGQAMTGAQPWIVRVSTTALGTCADGTWSATLEVFDLEGNNSGDLEVGTEPACGQCILGTVPVFEGVRAACLGPRVLFNPAIDTSTCGGVPDLTYELFASTTAGVLGQRVDNDPSLSFPQGTPCGPDNMQVEDRLPGATTWKVCDVENVYWTVIAVDGGGQRYPNIGAPGDPVPAGYQTQLLNCTLPITPGIFALVKPSATTLNLWLVPPIGVPSWGSMRPPGNANEYRLLRGTFPTGASGLRMMGTRIVGGPCGPAPGGEACRNTAYDHNAVTCAFSTTLRDVSAELSTAGSFYYLVPGTNSGGCFGMGFRATPGGSPGTLDWIEPIPGFGSGVIPNPSCPTPCGSP